MYQTEEAESAVASENRIIIEKLKEAQQRGYYRTFDLFAGCGGMSLGFHRAGMKSVGAIEIDKDARESHKINFGSDPDIPYFSHEDVTKTAPGDALNSPDEDTKEHSVDILVGGPPCQAFSRLGRAALWRLAGENHAHHKDERATMYQYYLGYVAELKPVAFVMENVREMAKFGGRNIAETVAEEAEKLGYNVRYTIINAVWFGVPQLRERLILIGIHKSLDIMPEFPVIQHEYKIPVGYTTSRSGQGRIEVLPPYDHYVDHFDKAPVLFPPVTAQMAFSDLPPVTHHLDGKKGKGNRRKVDDRLPYLTPPANPFQQAMRNWPEFTSAESFNGHVIRYTPRDYETFRRMPHGGMYPEALETAEMIFRERIRAAEEEAGAPVQEGSARWIEIRNNTVPPYKDNRYPNKFRKMWPDHPSRTVPAHIGKDAYSHIHFDSEQARGISLREAARLQSFPDGFKFAGSMNSQLKQIGNAVPPLLAFNIARSLRATLERVNLNE